MNARIDLHIDLQGTANRDEGLREQNELLDRIVAASPGGIVILDLEGRVSQVNPAATDLLGHPSEKLQGRTLGDLGTVLGDTLATLEPDTSRVLSLADGRRVRCQRAQFRDRGFARTFFLVEELTEKLRRSEKAAYEKLIRMMSHEVNNTVAAVDSLLGSLAGLGDQKDPDRRRDFEQALDTSSSRLDHLRVFMSGFAEVVRLPDPDRRPCDLAVLLGDLRVLMTPYFTDKGVRLELDLALRPSPVSLDKNQIEQVLLNLLKNAAEASPPDGAVTLRLGGSTAHPWIEIEDHGSGISTTDRSQLFTPFFTTKDAGRGLGLTVVKEILSRHGFGISLTSPERPTCFRVDLRRAPEALNETGKV